MPPRLKLTADDDDFDPTVIQHFREEGFDVTYLPYSQGGKAYRDKLRHLPDELELGENYVVVAYGDAAADCLEYHTKPQPHLAALIAYYPTTIKSPSAKYPTQLEVLCHLAATQAFSPAFRSYTYQGVEPGFAEHDLDEYNKVAASLAWSRTLGVIRKAFGIEADLENTLEDHIKLKYTSKDPAGTLRTMVELPYVNHVPTMTGGIGQKDLFLFYRDYFIPQTPASMSMKLISRTIGVDRVVDEMVITFQHSQEMSWILPDVPPTNKHVVIALVSIVCIRGGRLCQEHIYWDQASVLMQVGLLNPKLVPARMRKQGLEALPVVGAEGALKVCDEDSQETNGLISSWQRRPKGDPGVGLPTRAKEAEVADEAGAG